VISGGGDHRGDGEGSNMGRLKATWEGSEVEEVRYVYMYIYVFLYMGLDMSLDMGWMGSFEFGGKVVPEQSSYVYS
jgi:hypothetical protein